MKGFSTSTWFNQKITNLLGDFKEERQPEEDPSPIRAVGRIFFVVLLIIGLLLVVYHFVGSPAVWLEHINLSKQEKFVICSLYESNCKNYSPSLRCPCNSTSVRWRDFVSFSILQENSTDWNMTRGVNNFTPWIFVPEAKHTTLLRNHIVKNETILTSEEFCKLVSWWPVDNATKEVETPWFLSACHYMARTLLPGLDPIQNKSTEFLESPNLLNREVLTMLVAERARDSVLRGRRDLDMINTGSETLRKVYNLLADLLTSVLDRFEMEEYLAFYWGAILLQGNLNFMITFGQLEDASVFFLEYDKKMSFLYPNIDWMSYYKSCNPLYCEETKKMSVGRQAYRAFGLLGGVTTLVLGLVTMLLWPGFALVLGLCCKRSTASAGDPEHPQATLLPSTGGSLPLTPLSHNVDSASGQSGHVASLGPQLHHRPSQRHMKP